MTLSADYRCFGEFVKGAYRATLNVTEQKYVAPKLVLPKPVPFNTVREMLGCE